MSETQKINLNESSAPKTSGFSTKQTLPAFEKNLVKKMKIRKAFAGLTYANNIIAVVAFLFTIVTLFGASSYGQPWRLGFWTVEPLSSGSPAFLSVIGIATIVIDAIFFALVISQIIGNMILKNKLRLVFATRISCIMLAAVLLMMILGLCSQPVLPSASNADVVIYVSWIRYLSLDNSTHLSSGAIVILIQMVLVFAYCLGYIIFWCVVKAKANKVKKEIVDGIKSIKNIVTGKPQEQE